MASKIVAGIYRIICIKVQKCYVGQAVNLDKRRNEHAADLNRKKHHSKKLQRAWNRHKGEGFVYEELERIRRSKHYLVGLKDKLNQKEQYWIDYYNSVKKGYNMRHCIAKSNR